jgi:hypothetical protein
MASFYRRVPPCVQQDREMNHCWAAAFESWSTASPDRPTRTIQDLVDQYASEPDEGINELHLGYLLKDFRMGSRAGTFDLSANWLIEKLRFGHLILVYKSGQNSSHTLVVYGADSSEGVMSYMDPWYGAYRYWGVSNLNDRKKLVAWPK